jgi:hypothetical protein
MTGVKPPDARDWPGLPFSLVQVTIEPAISSAVSIVSRGEPIVSSAVS